jgi:probable phosphoglycerate mutase
MANLERRFAGNYNIDLSELGKKQAEATAKFVAENYKVDVVYASDLIRAYETGKAVADKFGLPVIKTEKMREINAGDWEGRKFDDLFENDANFRQWRENRGSGQCTNGESVRQLYDRIYNAINEIAEANDGKTVVIATHATPIRVTELRISGRDFNYMKNISWVTNASVSEFEYENGKLYAVKTAYDDHLSELSSTLPANV